VTDQFVDDLFEKLHTRRTEALTQAASASQARARVAEAARAWWDEFCQVVECKVDAWNAKDAPEARVTHSRSAAGSIVLWHRSVEAQLCLADARVVMTGRVGDTQPRESPFIDFSEARGSVSAILAGAHSAKSPSEAADHLLAPILTRAFGSEGPRP
jgi:hypothetical protein